MSEWPSCVKKETFGMSMSPKRNAPEDMTYFNFLSVSMIKEWMAVNPNQHYIQCSADEHGHITLYFDKSPAEINK